MKNDQPIFASPSSLRACRPGGRSDRRSPGDPGMDRMRGRRRLGFRIERAVCHSPCKPFAEIGKVGPHVAAFRDGSVEPCTTYSYRVHAWNASGDSSPSNVVEVTTPQIETEPPTDNE